MEVGKTVIELKNVSFAYNGVRVLDDVNLTVAEREFISVVGPNGGGKTTLLRIILGLLKPTAGTVLVLGEPPERSRVRVGYVPQSLHYDMLFPATVMDVVLMGRLGRPGLRGFLGWQGKRDREAARRALAEVDMEAFAERPLAALSGGQRQRVLIARALAGDPELLLLDEPTANIDAQVEDKLSLIIQELNKRITIIMVSHDPWFVSNMVQHVVCVNRTVAVHPTGKVEGADLHDFSGQSMRLVRHDRVCEVRDHNHD